MIFSEYESKTEKRLIEYENGDFAFEVTHKWLNKEERLNNLLKAYDDIEMKILKLSEKSRKIKERIGELDQNDD